MYKIQSFLCDNGRTNYVYTSGNAAISLNSYDDPKKEAIEFIGDYELENKLVILIGTGNGELIKQILKFSNPVGIFAIEPFDEIPLIVPSEHNVVMQSYSEYVSNSSSFKSFIYKYIGLEIEVLLHPNYEKTDPIYIRKILSSLNDSVKILHLNKNTELKFAKEWILEPLNNLIYTSTMPSLNLLENKFHDQIGVLVASGPSLMENLNFLHYAKKHAYIFAAGSAVNGLLNNNINPDFVTSFDSSIVNYETHFKNTKYTGPLIVGSIINSKIIENHSGKMFLGLESIDRITKIVRSNVVEFPTVPSVSIFTLQVMLYLGFKKIYLVGQDLALINGNYYAKGVNEHQASKNEKSTLKIENNNNGYTESTHPLLAFLESFNQVIESTTGVEFYNTSKYGAKIKGACYVNPSEIKFNNLKNAVDLNFQDVLDLEKGYKDRKTIITLLHETKDFLYENKECLSKINDNNQVKREDLVTVYEIFKSMRENDIIENVITHQFSFYTTKTSNVFEYVLNKQEISNSDLKLMVSEVFNLVKIYSDYLNVLISNID
jgi:hypothetical protein